MLHHGDCLDVMARLDADSIDAIVTDPPYELGFMGKAWDRKGVAFQAETWALALRLAKPGAHLLAFGGTRTYHRLACAIEDAGWEVRDCLVWAYASGFPKSHNLDGEWKGWGTALKPAWEPIVLARKPLVGTVAANVLAHGTGALNIDGCRIGYESDAPNPATNPSYRAANGYKIDRSARASMFQDASDREMRPSALGRWPANVVLTDPIFDGDTPGVVGGEAKSTGDGAAPSPARPGWIGTGYGGQLGQGVLYGDSGTYSRFFLVPKAARSDREPVLGADVRADVELPFDDFNKNVGNKPAKRRANVHPTVKPTELMRHLIRLVTPPRGVILDPFLGSGTTALAAEMEGFEWIGIEREAEYVAIAEARLNGVQRGLGLETA